MLYNRVGKNTDVEKIITFALLCAPLNCFVSSWRLKILPIICIDTGFVVLLLLESTGIPGKNKRITIEVKDTFSSLGYRKFNFRVRFKAGCSGRFCAGL